MNEAQWRTGTRLHPLLEIVRRSSQPRRWRLLACACVREDWDSAPQEAREAIEAAEAYADGQIHHNTLKRARKRAQAAFERLGPSSRAAEIARRAASAADPSPLHAFEYVIYRGVTGAGSDGILIEARWCALIRDVFGNPYRTAAIDPAWLAANEAAAVKIAAGVYEERAFGRLPILADALIDAGCTAEDIIEHCRSDGPHVRGCWVVDAVLKKSPVG